MECGICGGTTFTRRKILWDALINEWQLSIEEAEYVERQQGETCDSCGSNLRSIALANAIRAHLGTIDVLKNAVRHPKNREMSVLEINEAGSLTPFLKQFEGYVFGAYPALDMHAIPYEGSTFDIVVHSDTLEHVINPIHALSECRRVLKPTGALCFTIPTIVGRMTRDRAGLPLSYHGTAGTNKNDLAVHTEFGADAWTYAMRAGFTAVTLHAIGYPAAIAMHASSGWTVR